MKRIYIQPYHLVEPVYKTGPDNPVTAYYLTNHYHSLQRELAFPENADQKTWESWRNALQLKLREILCLDAWGEVPSPSIKVIEETKGDGYIRKKVCYETVPGNWVTAYLLVPEGVCFPVPAVICPHGHFDGGKLSVVDPQKAAGVAYGYEFAKRGFIVLAPDNAGMGERDLPPSEVSGEKKGGCDLLFRRLNHMGLDLTGLRVFELMAGINILSALKEVDESRIGCAGLSGGCWLSQVLTALDERIKAVILSGYFTTFVQTAWLGHCVCHHPFGIGKVCDMPDISALIAPRPQFIESGKQDSYYPVEPAFTMVKQAYSLRNAVENLKLDLYDGAHMFHGKISIPWMMEQLQK